MVHGCTAPLTQAEMGQIPASALRDQGRPPMSGETAHWSHVFLLVGHPSPLPTGPLPAPPGGDTWEQGPGGQHRAHPSEGEREGWRREERYQRLCRGDSGLGCSWMSLLSGMGDRGLRHSVREVVAWEAAPVIPELQLGCAHLGPSYSNRGLSAGMAGQVALFRKPAVPV